MAIMARAPDCKWAQRKDKVLFTINVPNLDQSKAKVDITDKSFSFECPMAGTTEGTWNLKFDFFGEVDPSKSKWNVGTRDVSFVFQRKTEGPYWDRLNKGAKLTTLKCDWDKWKDEDEAKEDFDMSGYGDFDGGMGGGFGGMDDAGPDSDDDEDIPGLDADEAPPMADKPSEETEEMEEGKEKS